MRSPWEQAWAQGQAAGMARAPGAARGIRLGVRAAAAAAAAEAEAPLSRATASTRTFKLAWTTSESLEQEKEQQGSADFMYRHAARRAGHANDVHAIMLILYIARASC